MSRCIIFDRRRFMLLSTLSLMTPKALGGEIFKRRQLTIDASRTALVSGDGAFFALAQADGSPLSQDDLLYGEFFWDFGAAESRDRTAIPALSRLRQIPKATDARYAQGVYAGHDFLAPGAGTVTVWGVDAAGNEVEASLAVEVADADAAFDGDRTICFSAAGDFSGAPAGSICYAPAGATHANLPTGATAATGTLDDARVAANDVILWTLSAEGLAGSGDDAAIQRCGRLLLRDDEVHDRIDRFGLNGVYLSRFGGGTNRPVLRVDPNAGPDATVRFSIDIDNGRPGTTVRDIELRGDFDPANPPRVRTHSMTVTGISAISADPTPDTAPRDLTLSGIRISGVEMGIYPNAARVVMTDCDVSVGANYGMFCTYLWDGALRGNRFWLPRQSPRSARSKAYWNVSWIDPAVTGSPTGPGTTPVRDHGPNRLWPAYDRNVRSLAPGTDWYLDADGRTPRYASGNGAGGVADAAIATDLLLDPEGWLVERDTGRRLLHDTKHGPVRIAWPIRVSVDANSMESHGGWSGIYDTRQIQPALRFATNNTGGSGCIHRNYFNHHIKVGAEASRRVVGAADAFVVRGNWFDLHRENTSAVEYSYQNTVVETNLIHFPAAELFLPEQDDFYLANVREEGGAGVSGVAISDVARFRDDPYVMAGNTFVTDMDLSAVTLRSAKPGQFLIPDPIPQPEPGEAPYAPDNMISNKNDVGWVWQPYLEGTKTKSGREPLLDMVMVAPEHPTWREENNAFVFNGAPPTLSGDRGQPAPGSILNVPALDGLKSLGAAGAGRVTAYTLTGARRVDPQLGAFGPEDDLSGFDPLPSYRAPAVSVGWVDGAGNPRTPQAGDVLGTDVTLRAVIDDPGSPPLADAELERIVMVGNAPAFDGHALAEGELLDGRVWSDTHPARPIRDRAPSVVIGGVVGELFADPFFNDATAWDTFEIDISGGEAIYETVDANRYVAFDQPRSVTPGDVLALRIKPSVVATAAAGDAIRLNLSFDDGTTLTQDVPVEALAPGQWAGRDFTVPAGAAQIVESRIIARGWSSSLRLTEASLAPR
jgi:hypothetical protein